MADGFRLVPVEAKVAARDGEVGRDGQFLTGPRSQESTVVSDTETQADSPGGATGAVPYLTQEGELTAFHHGSRMGLLSAHLLRMAQTCGRLLRW
jgi:hypothetical protein